MDLVGRFRVGERISVVLAAITVTVFAALCAVRWIPLASHNTTETENFSENAPSFRQNLPVATPYNETVTPPKEMKDTVIYLDVLICVNWLIDFLLLRACARILHLPDTRGRQVLSALFGGGCACVILLPTLTWWASLSVKLVSACVMTLIAFTWRGIGHYLRQTVLLFVLSALFGGMAMMLFTLAAPAGFFVANGVVYYDIPPLWLAALCGVSYGIVCISEHLFRRHGKAGGAYRLTVTDAGGSVTLSALHDSGNRLCEVFSGAPVIVAQRDAVVPVLSPALRRTLDAVNDNAESHTAETAMTAGWRWIPFRSVGGNGLLPAFRPAKLTVQKTDGTVCDISGCYIALTPALGRGDYQALIGSDPLSWSRSDQTASVQKGDIHEMVT